MDIEKAFVLAVMIEYISILVVWLILGVATTMIIRGMHKVTKFEAVIFTLGFPLVIVVTAIYLVRRI